MDFAELLESYKLGILQEIRCAFLASMIVYDHVNLVARVQPLGTTLTDTKPAPLPPVNADVLVLGAGKGFFVRPWYVPGDVVVCVVPQQSSEGRKAGIPTPESEGGLHNLSNAVVIGGIINYKSAQIADPGLVITNLTGTTKATFTDAKIEMRAPITKIVSPLTEITGNVQVSGTVTAANFWSGLISLIGHLHNIISPSPGTPVTPPLPGA